MRPDDLLEFYRRDKRTSILLNSIAEASSKVELKGEGSSLALVTGGILERELENDINRNHLFILEDKEQAAYFMNDLEQVMVKTLALCFCSHAQHAFHIKKK